MNDDFKTALESFITGCQAITDKRREDVGLTKCKYSYTEGKRYIKVWRIDVHENLHCFIDMTNGDVLKVASASKPAKHARGNIFDAHNGLKTMGPFGPAYLK